MLGLTVLVINSRIKEIGIRKVIGASGFTIFRLLAGSFVLQLIIGIALSIPITDWLMTDWLSDFAYRINMSAEMFVLGGLISVVVALLAIGFHTIKASLTNPVDSIKAE